MAPLPKIAVGGAPPPRLPGVVFPKKKNLHFCKDQSNHSIFVQVWSKQKNCTAWFTSYALQNQKESRVILFWTKL